MEVERRRRRRGPVRVFVSYRRADDQSFVGRLYDRLAAEFGRERVFRDLDSITPGRPFNEVISAALTTVDVVIAPIGAEWGAARLQSADDFVRIELSEALRLGKPIIPVLLGPTPIPSSQDLPSELRPLLELNFARVRGDPDFHHDCDALIRAVISLLSNDAGRTGFLRVRLHQLGSGLRRRLWRRRIAAVTTTLILVAVALVVFWTRRDTPGGSTSDTQLHGNDESSTTSGQTPALQESQTTLGRNDNLPECPTPGSEGWTALDLSGTAEVGSGAVAWVFALVGGASRPDPAGEAGRWQLLLDVDVSRDADSPVSEYHYRWFYEAAFGTGRYDPTCFSLTGQNPIGPGGLGHALVGFDIAVDPLSGGVLLLHPNNNTGRIDIVPE